ncbi:tRNA isopentenyl-2-thiomethyl-A-37 hydroxylase MiaE, partial [Enterobacter asburiae]
SESFAALAPFLDDDLQKFYLSLLRSEARHYQDYQTLPPQVSDDDISPRIKLFGEIEATLISTPDNEFSFHSGLAVKKLQKKNSLHKTKSNHQNKW